VHASRKIANDIIARIYSAQTYDDVYAGLKSAGSVYGYDAFLIAGLPRKDEGGDILKLLSGNWPAGWTERYTEQGYLRDDPVVAHGLRTTQPYLWREAVEATGAARGLHVMDEAREFGLAEGFCVPLLLPDGGFAGVTFGSKQLRLSAQERAGLHLVSLGAFTAACAIGERTAQMRVAAEEIGLTEREVDCLKWAADGLITDQIADLLTLSARTVEFHFTSASRKLRTMNRTHAVAEAIRRGIIY
jgi:LuxR family quorum sensing-dependent transcriptional regulator